MFRAQLRGRRGDGPLATRRRCSVLEYLESRLCLDATQPTPTITDMTVTPSVNEGGTVTLDVAFTDSRDIDHDVTVTWGDGKTDRLTFMRDERAFQLTHVYLDDDPSGTPEDLARVNVTITAASLIQGTDAVFIVDISGSTSDTFQGTPVGDLNGDGSADTILDAQIAGFKALNQRLIDVGLGTTARVALVSFSTTATVVDMDPAAAGTQIATSPMADADADGLRDVDEALASLVYAGSTNFEAALQKAISAFQTWGTAPGQGTAVFLSDGYPNAGGPFTDETAILTTTMGLNVRAFGVGTASSLTELQKIDPRAVQFTTTDELLNVFTGGGQTGGGTATATRDVRVLNVAPVVAAGADQSVKEGTAVVFTATVTDAGALDTHTVTWTVTNASGKVVARETGPTLRYTPTVAGTYTVTATATDDDTGVGTDTAVLRVTKVGDRKVPPKVVALRRLGLSGGPTRLLVTFDRALDEVSAERRANFRLVCSGADRRFGTGDDMVVRLDALKYLPTSHAVRLRAAMPLPSDGRYRLKVLGHGPTCVKGADGVDLDGSGLGHAGTNFVRIFGRDVLRASPTVMGR